MAEALLSGALRQAIRLIALALPAGQVHRLVEALAAHEAPDTRARVDGLAVAPVPRFRSTVSGLLEAWEAHPAVRGSLVAAGVLGAVDAAEALRASQSIDVVWTGPSTPGSRCGSTYALRRYGGPAG